MRTLIFPVDKCSAIATTAPDGFAVTVSQDLLRAIEVARGAQERVAAHTETGMGGLISLSAHAFAELVHKDPDDEHSLNLMATPQLMASADGISFRAEEETGDFAESAAVPPDAFMRAIRQILSARSHPASDRARIEARAVADLQQAVLAGCGLPLGPTGFDSPTPNEPDRAVMVGVIAIDDPEEADAGVTGLYEVAVSDQGIPQASLANAALDIFHSHVAIDNLECFHIWCEDAGGSQLEQSGDKAYLHSDAGFIATRHALPTFTITDLQRIFGEECPALSVSVWRDRARNGTTTMGYWEEVFEAIRDIQDLHSASSDPQESLSES